MVNSPGWHGVFPYLPTPIDPDGNLNAERMAWLVERVVDAGVDGVTPLGSTGEGPLLSTGVRASTIEVAVDAAAGRVPVVPGVTGLATNDLVRQADQAQLLGADGVLLMLQTYYPLAPDEVLSAVRSVVAAIDVPVVFYHRPTFCGIHLDEAIVALLHQEGGIDYFKDASGELSNIRRWPKVAGPGLRIFAATSVSPVAALTSGACGLMSGPASMFPAECRELFRCASTSDAEGARVLERSLASTLALFRTLGPNRAVKALFAADGVDLGSPVAPVRPITPVELRAAAGCIVEVRDRRLA